MSRTESFVGNESPKQLDLFVVQATEEDLDMQAANLVPRLRKIADDTLVANDPMEKAELEFQRRADKKTILEYAADALSLITHKPEAKDAVYDFYHRSHSKTLTKTLKLYSEFLSDTRFEDEMDDEKIEILVDLCDLIADELRSRDYYDEKIADEYWPN